MCVQSGLILCDPMDCSLQGSSVHGNSQARILEWVAISSSSGSSWPRDQTHVSCISCIGRWIFYHWATWEAPAIHHVNSLKEKNYVIIPVKAEGVFGSIQHPLVIILSKLGTEKNLLNLISTTFNKSTAAAVTAKSLQLCPTLCDLTDGSSHIPGILQARILEWVAISFSNAWKWKIQVKSFSRVRLPATPWTTAYQAPPSVGFSRQEYWSGVLLPSLNKSTANIKSTDEQLDALPLKLGTR